ncbi:hypothetical protein M8494_10250 [Serratia ureilytica]
MTAPAVRSAAKAAEGAGVATLRAIVFNKPADIDDPFSDVQLSGEFN